MIKWNILTSWWLPCYHLGWWKLPFWEGCCQGVLFATSHNIAYSAVKKKSISHIKLLLVISRSIGFCEQSSECEVLVEFQVHSVQQHPAWSFKTVLFNKKLRKVIMTILVHQVFWVKLSYLFWTPNGDIAHFTKPLICSILINGQSVIITVYNCYAIPRVPCITYI